ncbi:ATP synthase subunit delta, mitochondrial [Daktulosphaira vitifoliae]|uniref:ATP synthase subunit delta, mitochondrial n=1 Tax=Daktulosphaira vitifoliae TaxID=58002 RepID=UPI0021AA6A89|nr:ATP synthase subunit delta, mitochondrial [Daktulosphaira vitifoliae]XP_050538471.1 ATP synthase subunit delta, mitochondrial [Daktulosphaira vitifoliae]
MAVFFRSRLVTQLAQGTSKCFSRNYADQMSFTFAAANQVYYTEQNVKQVDVPSFSGSFGILPNHVPTLAVLRPGVVTVYENDTVSKKIFVSSGTVTVNEDSSVQVLAEEAHPLEDLDASAARQILQESQSKLATASDEVAKAEAAIAVEVAEALVLATGN